MEIKGKTFTTRERRSEALARSCPRRADFSSVREGYAPGYARIPLDRHSGQALTPFGAACSLDLNLDKPIRRSLCTAGSALENSKCFK